MLLLLCKISLLVQQSFVKIMSAYKTQLLPRGEMLCLFILTDKVWSFMTLLYGYHCLSSCV